MDAINTFYVCILPPRSAVLLTPVICGSVRRSLSTDTLILLQGPISLSHPLTDKHLSVQVPRLEEELTLDTVSTVHTQRANSLYALISVV